MIEHHVVLVKQIECQLSACVVPLRLHEESSTQRGRGRGLIRPCTGTTQRGRGRGLIRPCTWTCTWSEQKFQQSRCCAHVYFRRFTPPRYKQMWLKSACTAIRRWTEPVLCHTFFLVQCVVILLEVYIRNDTSRLFFLVYLCLCVTVSFVDHRASNPPFSDVN